MKFCDNQRKNDYRAVRRNIFDTSGSKRAAQYGRWTHGGMAKQDGGRVPARSGFGRKKRAFARGGRAPSEGNRDKRAGGTAPQGASRAVFRPAFGFYGARASRGGGGVVPRFADRGHGRLCGFHHHPCDRRAQRGDGDDSGEPRGARHGGSEKAEQPEGARHPERTGGNRGRGAAGAGGSRAAARGGYRSGGSAAD